MLPDEAIEELWERLAAAIDQAGPEHDRLMLAKLVLLLADALGDAPRAASLIQSALEDLT